MEEEKSKKNDLSKDNFKGMSDNNNSDNNNSKFASDIKNFNQQMYNQHNPSNRNNQNFQNNNFCNVSNGQRQTPSKCYKNYIYYYNTIMYYPRYGWELLDSFILEGYTSLVFTSEDIINKILKSNLKFKQILFYLFLLMNFLIIYLNFNTATKNVKNEVKTDEIDKQNFNFIKSSLSNSFLMVNFILIMVIYRIFKTNPGIIEKDPDFEQFIMKKIPKFEMCNECNIPKPIRSFHCSDCKKCVSKFEIHSYWFNRDIGSGNAFLYAVFLILLNITFIVSITITSLSTFYFEEFNNKDIIALLWSVTLIYVIIKTISFTKKIIKGITKNLTYQESNNCSRFSYLWANFSRMFFNPFDRGIIKNIKDCYSSYLDSDLSYKKFRSNKNEYSEISICDKIENKPLTSVDHSNCDKLDVLNESEINVVEIKSNNEQKNSNYQLNQYNNNSIFHKENGIEPINVIEDKNKFFYISNTNKCYYEPYTHSLKNDCYGINWTKLRIYTIIDLFTSPIREGIIRNLPPKFNYLEDFNPDE